MRNTIIRALLLLLAQRLYAADIAGEVRSGADGPDAGDGGFLEVGTAFGAWTRSRVGDTRQASVGLIVSGQYRYKGFFIESVNGTADGVNLGYQLWNDDQWTVDLIGFNGTNGSVGEMDPHLGDTARSKWLIDRHTAMTGAGLRVTRYFDDYILQFRALNDVYHNRGNYASARLGRSWQVRNWNFHALAGLEYTDARFNQRIHGVSAAEATRSFAPYSPGATLAPEVEVGITYPVTEHWIMRLTLRNSFLPDAVTDSPLYREDSSQSQFFASFSYVF